MFLKRERPQTDEFVIKKISGCEGKTLSINFIILEIKCYIYTYIQTDRHTDKASDEGVPRN